MLKTSIDFMKAPQKSITLMGMSGIGKSHLALMMKNWGWGIYSCDVAIGQKYLADDLKETLGPDTKITAENISLLSDFIGKVGNMPYQEFKRRQKLYYNAEMAALEEAITRSAQNDKFVIDSTGSLCEIEDKSLLEKIGKNSLLVYIKTSKEQENEILERAQQYPKPLFYPPARLDAWVHEYMQVFGAQNEDNIPANDFARWVFPRLLEARLPKYQSLAERYGVTIPSKDLYTIQSENDLFTLIQNALPQS